MVNASKTNGSSIAWNAPRSRSAFRYGLANTVLTPHTGYVVSQVDELFYRHIVEDIAAWRVDVPVRVIVPG